eukprot:4256852-Pyramimonas_sp.AAC.1
MQNLKSIGFDVGPRPVSLTCQSALIRASIRSELLQDMVEWIRNASPTVEATLYALSRPFHPDSVVYHMSRALSRYLEFPNAVQDAPPRKLQMKIYRVLRSHAPDPPPASLVRARVMYWTKEVPRRDQTDRL